MGGSGSGIATAPIANTGAGGSGGGANGNNSGVTSGSSGGAGGYIEAFIYNPSSTYAYSVPTGGAAGSSSGSGTAGASGIIIVEEHYQ
jgi:hypothetical protein